MFDFKLSAEQVLFLPILWIAVILHEMAHAYAAWWAGDDTAARENRLTFNPLSHLDPIGTVLIPILMMITPGIRLPLIGWAKPVPVNPMRFKSPKWKIIVALAGVTVNLALAFISVICIKIFVVSGLYQHVSPNFEETNLADIAFIMLRGLMLINIVLMLFNLIPIPPLDGSHVFLYFIKTRDSVAFRIFAFLERYGFFILIFLVMIGALEFVLGPVMNTILRFMFFMVGL